jgi:hypothetical protein
MVFTSGGFPPGTTGYNLLAFAVALIVITATLAFMLLLGFEIFRSVKFAEVHVLARRVEEEVVEEVLLSRRRRSTAAGMGLGPVSPARTARRRSSVFSGNLQWEANLAQRLDMALGGPGAPLGLTGTDGATSGSPGRGERRILGSCGPQVQALEAVTPLMDAVARVPPSVMQHAADRPGAGDAVSTAALGRHRMPPLPHRRVASFPEVSRPHIRDDAVHTADGGYRSTRVLALKSSRERALKSSRLLS